MKKKIFWIAAIGAIWYLSTPKASAAVIKKNPQDSPLNGKAIKVAGTTALYHVFMGQTTPYENYQAYLNHGAPEIVVITQAEFDTMPHVTNSMFFEIGGNKPF